MKSRDEIINFAINFVPKLSPYETQQMNLEKQGHKKSNSFRFKSEIDYARIAEINEIKRIIDAAKAKGLNPVVEVCKMVIRKQDGKQFLGDYGQFVKKDGKRISKVIKTNDSAQLMECSNRNKKAFYENYLKPAFSGIGKDFVIDCENREIIAEMFKYFIKDPSCRLDLKKGLNLCGPVGTGKTALMEAFSKFTNDYKFPNAFRMVYMDQLNQEIAKRGISAIANYMQGDICFDDIAIRKKAIKSFGTEVMPSDDIIHGRYRRFTKPKSRLTHYTTNIDFDPEKEKEKEELEKTYDKRSIDRMQEKCNFIYLGGPSRRKQ